MCRHTAAETEKETGRPTDRQTHTQTDKTDIVRQADGDGDRDGFFVVRQTDRQRQTGGQTDRERDTQIVEGQTDTLIE